MQNIIIFGTGLGAEKVLNSIDFEKYKIIAFLDNNEKKQGQIFHGITIKSPNDLSGMEFDYIIICSVYFKEIQKQLIIDYKINPSKLKNNLFFVKERLVNYYKTQQFINEDEREVLEYLKVNDLNVFNYNFTKNYDYKKINVSFDSDVNMFYVIHNGKRMYFKESFKNEDEVAKYYYLISIEQDINSPHRYLMDEINVKKGDVVIDAGVAEGNFALEIIDNVSKIFLIESDKSWIKALKQTFKDYEQKVIIVDKFLTDFNDDRNITIDKLIGEEKVDFIKMDIEGEEIAALKGAKNVLNNNANLKLNICSYHNFDDEQRIKEYLSDFDFKIKISNGYMFFVNDEIYNDKTPRLTRGLVRATKSL